MRAIVSKRPALSRSSSSYTVEKWMVFSSKGTSRVSSVICRQTDLKFRPTRVVNKQNNQNSQLNLNWLIKYTNSIDLIDLIALRLAFWLQIDWSIDSLIPRSLALVLITKRLIPAANNIDPNQLVISELAIVAIWCLVYIYSPVAPRHMSQIRSEYL